MYKREVTEQTLRAGAAWLGMPVPQRISVKKLKEAVRRKLAEHQTYGRVACGGCGNDVNAEVNVCPFCGAGFEPLIEQLERQEKEAAASKKPDPFWEKPNPAFKQAWEDDDEEVDDDFQLQSEQKAPAPTPKPNPKPKPKKSSPRGKKGKAAMKKREKERKEKEREEKREQIRQALPFTEPQLRDMTRTTLVMTASVVGIKNPMRAGGADVLIPQILAKQEELQRNQ